MQAEFNKLFVVFRTVSLDRANSNRRGLCRPFVLSLVFIRERGGEGEREPTTLWRATFLPIPTYLHIQSAAISYGRAALGSANVFRKPRN